MKAQKAKGGGSGIAVIFGTRPEIIKLSSIIRHLHKRRLPYFMVHTGQHYSFEMDRVFFRDLELPEPQVQLMGKSKGSQAEHTGRMMADIERVLLDRRPSAVLVQGDTNSVLSGALAASKLPGIRIGHVEAGLRSNDRTMPEEINRIVTDHLSDWLFAPTRQTASLLRREGVSASKIHVTGNTIVDAVLQNLELAKRKVATLYKDPYFLMTLHRQENVDFKDRLAGILEGVGRTADRFKRAVVFPMHPRTASKIKAFGLKLPGRVRVIEPVGFLEFLRLEGGAELLLSDSGGVQEEGCILGVPCVTLRTSTERPETVSVGANVIAGREPSGILRAAEKMLSSRKRWKNPFGDGRSGERILEVVWRELASA